MRRLFLCRYAPPVHVPLSNDTSRDVRFFLTVYGSVAAANTVFTALRAFLFAYGVVRAASVIHDRLLDQVLQVRPPQSATLKT